MEGAGRGEGDVVRDLGIGRGGSVGTGRMRDRRIAGRIDGEKPWRYEKPRQNMYDIEHAELFQSIRNGKPINNGHYMMLSSALAVVAQMACYSGQVVPWDEAMQSKRSFSLPRYGWDVEPPIKPGPEGRYPSALQSHAEYDKWLT